MMAATKHLVITMPSDREIVHTRSFDAQRETVFAFLTQPDLLVRWYGPRGWALVSCEIDFRVGGAWRFVTRQPDGREIVQYGVYTEIVPPERFANTEHWLDWDVGEVVVTTELIEQDGRTTLTHTTRFPSRKVRDQLVALGADRGAAEHYDKLEGVLATISGPRSRG